MACFTISMAYWILLWVYSSILSFTVSASFRSLLYCCRRCSLVNGLKGNSETFALTDIPYVNFTDLSTGLYPSEKQKPEFLILFPNPVQDILTLNYKSLGEAIQFEVMTLDGKTVQRNFFNPLIL